MVLSTSAGSPWSAGDCARIAASGAISAIGENGGDQPHGACRLCPPGIGIKNRDQASFELRRSCHRDGGGGSRGLGLHSACDLQQMRSVIDGVGARREHQIIGGAFALAEECAPGAPRQRIPPVERQGRPRQKVGGGIAAAHMRELVQQHDPAAVFTPIRGARGHQHGGPQHAEGHRHARRVSPGRRHLGDAEVARQRRRPARSKRRGLRCGACATVRCRRPAFEASRRRFPLPRSTRCRVRQSIGEDTGVEDGSVRPCAFFVAATIPLAAAPVEVARKVTAPPSAGNSPIGRRQMQRRQSRWRAAAARAAPRRGGPHHVTRRRRTSAQKHRDHPCRAQHQSALERRAYQNRPRRYRPVTHWIFLLSWLSRSVPTSGPVLRA